MILEWDFAILRTVIELNLQIMKLEFNVMIYIVERFMCVFYGPILNVGIDFYAVGVQRTHYRLHGSLIPTPYSFIDKHCPSYI